MTGLPSWVVEHAQSLAKFAGLFARLGRLDDFERFAASWPAPGEIQSTPEDTALAVWLWTRR